LERKKKKEKAGGKAARGAEIGSVERGGWVQRAVVALEGGQEGTWQRTGERGQVEKAGIGREVQMKQTGNEVGLRGWKGRDGDVRLAFAAGRELRG
jgi:hypothetical protein